MSFAALALRARAANDTTRAQINNIPLKSHFIVLLTCLNAVFSGPYLTFLIGRLADFPDSNRCENDTRYLDLDRNFIQCIS